MGRSKSLEKMLAEEKRNKERLDEISRDLEAQLKGADEELRQYAKNFYQNDGRNWDYNEYISGKQSDFQLEDSWSLGNLSEIINKISNAVVGTVTGQITNVPEGTTVSPDAKEINKSGNLTDDTRLLVATNCFNLLSGIVNSFGSISKVQVHTASSTIPIGQGLRIFASVATNVSQQRSFFNNKILCTYRYVYFVSYSVDEFHEQAERTLVAQYERTLNALNKASIQNDDKFSNGSIDLDQYLETADKLEARTLEVIRKIEQLKKKDGDLKGIAELHTRQNNFLIGRKIELARTKNLAQHFDKLIQALKSE
ncbi:hypothetical protein [Pectobacterium punjabense]|uniref:Uncharacterized protein n=1 Tax=Pectobacterium punjabense TaxID=2108399 RepID=A0ABX6KY15_9GAMM|nr:hypothetical protein [Pectobacterium punjabense]MBN3135939.1 hypothetical protein [Pectobacterium punjabense]MBS4432795.1 hypothetical protein [Pectobacterium punjabense]MBT9185969.1 hypothetical protein [Pectobacterium punjabense]MCE5382074.1 hypothetical protein [Pectobacterium punjabense]PTA63310.1 hypothetical protein C9I36_15900 [Pectobacterium punjabense]